MRTTGGKPPSDPSVIVVPFGKHKGKTVGELLVADPAYAEWVTAQDWVSERFAELHAAILSRGAGTDDSPEHNALQARFIEPSVRLTLVQLLCVERIAHKRRECAREDTSSVRSAIATAKDNIKFHEMNVRLAEAAPERHSFYGKVEEQKERLEIRKKELAELEIQLKETPYKEWPLLTGVTFEQKGIDVVIEAFFESPGIVINVARLRLELKPTMGDDYPTVMRQMMRLGAAVLVLGTYTGRGVSEPQMRAMFEASGIRVVFVQEIEEAMRRT